MARGQGFVTKCVAGRAWPEPKSVGILGGNWRRRSPFIPGPLGARELQLLLQGGYLLFCRLEDALQGGGAMGAGSRALLGELFPPWDEKEAQADPPGAGASRPAPPAPPRPAPPAPMCLGGGDLVPCRLVGRRAGPGGTAPGGRWPGPVRHARTAPPARPAAGHPTAASGGGRRAHQDPPTQGDEGGREAPGVPPPAPAWTAGGVPANHQGWFLLFPLLAAWTAGGVPANRQGFLLFPLLLLGQLLGAFLPRRERERDRGAPLAPSAFSPAAGG